MSQFYKAKYIIQTGEKVFEDSILVVKNGKVEQILKQVQNDNGDFEIIDYGNAVITSGFVNLHTHLQYTDLKPVFKPDTNLESIAKNVDFADWILNLVKQYYFLPKSKKIKSFKNGLREVVSSGCTTIAQLSGEDFFPEIVRNLGLNSFFFLETFSNNEKNSKKAILKLKEQIKTIRDKTASNVILGISPHSIYNVHKSLWEEISKFAAEENLLVHTHLAESSDETNWLNGKPSGIDKLHKFVWLKKMKPCEAGLDPVAYLEKLGVLGILKENLTTAHCIELDGKSLEIKDSFTVTLEELKECYYGIIEKFMA